MIRNVR